MFLDTIIYLHFDVLSCFVPSGKVILLEFNIVLRSLIYRSMSSAKSIGSAAVDRFILETSSM